MSSRIRRKCTRTMKIMSLASVNDENFISDGLSIFNSSQSSCEESVFNCSTSTNYYPGYLEVSTDHLKSSSCNNQKDETRFSDLGESEINQENMVSSSPQSVLDGDDDSRHPEYHFEDQSSSDSSEEDDVNRRHITDQMKGVQNGSNGLIKKSSETKSNSGRMVPIFNTNTLRKNEEPSSCEKLQTTANHRVENKSQYSEYNEDYNNNHNSQLITVNHRSLMIETSNRNTKKHFCTFCKTKQTKLARHLQNKHIDEREVQLFLNLPVKSVERLEIISKLRKQGDALYNGDENYNKGDIIVVRRPHLKKKRNAEHYLPCGECSAMYSILSLRTHYKKCSKTKNKFQRNVVVESRVKTFVNIKANSIMRNRILPPIRFDEIGRLVRNEDLIILFGNRLTQKYRSPHLYKMIRSRLRCVANFYWHYQQRNPQLKKFEDMFDPQNYDEVVTSINIMAGLNEDTGQYKAPATNIGTYLKKLSLYLISEMIKQKNQKKLQDVREFLQLLEDSLTYDIYKTVTENQLEIKRNKIINLPTLDDISLLRDHLNEKIKLNFEKLTERFSRDSWKDLSGALLIALLLFNRRRAGEIERTKIQDFEQYEAVNVNDEMACELEGEHVENYVRFLIRGKRGRNVPVLVDKYKLICLKLVLKYRETAGTPTTNPYVFGIPGKDSVQHLNANKLIVNYSNTCGAKYPERLRGTQLRKHFATKCGTMNLKGVDLKDVADYMGHHEKIHLEHYRMPNATRDIVRMSRILEKAQGVDNSPSSGQLEQSCYIGNYEAEKTNDSAVSEVDANDLENSKLNSSRYKKRVSWNNNEKTVVETKAKFYLENFESPTLSYCSSLIKEEAVLKNRTPYTLKAYIMNKIKQRKQDCMSPKLKKKCSRGVKRFWSDEEKEKVKKIFQNEMKTKKLPSLATCRKVIMENRIFSGRTPEMLKAFLSNTFKKKY